MERHSEFPLFIQSAVAIFGFLLVLSLLGWVMEPKASLHKAAASNHEVSAIR